jgi:gas vesicle protein
MKSSSKIALFSFIAGAAAGAVLGLLFAPDKGSVTRQKIKTKAKEFSDEVSDKFDQMKDEMKNIKDRLKTDRKEKNEVHPE